jgi:hypothetical protein
MVMAQVLIFGQVNLFNYAFCIVYITVILSASESNGTIANMLIAFVMGMIIDSFNYTLGVNALAAVSLAYFRLNIYSFITFQTRDEQLETNYTIGGVGMFNFSLYVLLGAVFYTSIYYFTVSWGWVYFWKNITRILFSSLLSTLVIIGINILFFRREKML